MSKKETRMQFVSQIKFDKSESLSFHLENSYIQFLAASFIKIIRFDILLEFAK